MSLNKVLLIGNVGKDPEIRHLEGGASVATITLATSERYKDKSGELKELTEWHTIVAWRQLADLASNYIRKGTQIYVEGRIRSRSYDDQNGNKRYVTEILADSIQLLGRRSDSAVPTGGAYDQTASQSSRGGWGGQSTAAQQPAARPEPQVSQPMINPSDLTDDGADDLPF
jgi:single stranded DNA-binding protein (ssb)